ncbi:MAG: Uma2 family endonuclease [Gammaproteobacteria bacterium]|nr:Uma2 family endonuclease [Gammaproteobacteria bacterium]
MSEALVTPSDPVEYPTRDGRPVAETDLHYLRLAGAAYGLRKFLADRDDVYVGSNLMVFDEPGNPRRHLSPDVFVAFGVRRGSRDLFKIWEEKPPSFVLEITSKTTRREDERTKRQRYAQLGVPEYFLYDPRGEWVKPPLQGFTLQGRRYRRMTECVLPNGKRGLECKTLALYLWLRDGELRLYEPVSGRDLPTPEEEGAARELAEERLDAAVGTAKAAEQKTRQDVSAMLARQAERRFGAHVATRLSALLQRAPSMQTITEVGDQVMQAATADELLSMVEALVER